MTTFHPFPQLPWELRAQIWEMAVEPRNVSVVLGYNDFKLYSDHPKFELWGPRIWTYTPAPAALHACQVDQDEEDWWWRINRDDVRKEITTHPDHPAKDKDKKPSTASVCGEQAPRRRIRTRYLRGRKPYYEDILANLNARAADESSSPSSSSSSESSCVSVVSYEPDYMGMLDSGILPELFSSDSDGGGGEETAVPVEQVHLQKDRPYDVAVGTSTSSESEMEHGSRLVFYAERWSDHLTALNSHTRSR